MIARKARNSNWKIIKYIRMCNLALYSYLQHYLPSWPTKTYPTSIMNKDQFHCVWWQKKFKLAHSPYIDSKVQNNNEPLRWARTGTDIRLWRTTKWSDHLLESWCRSSRWRIWIIILFNTCIMCAELLLYGYCFTGCLVMLHGMISKHIKAFIYYYYYNHLLVVFWVEITFNQTMWWFRMVSTGIVNRLRLIRTQGTLLWWGDSTWTFFSAVYFWRQVYMHFKTKNRALLSVYYDTA